MVDEYIEGLLAPVGLPLAYRQFLPYKDKPVPEPPYLVYYFDNESGYGADDWNLIIHKQVTVELYTNRKNTELEAFIEDALRSYEYDKYEDYLIEESMNMVSYEFNLYQKNRR